MARIRSLKILHLPINSSGAIMEISSALNRRGHRSRLMVINSRHFHDKFEFLGDIEFTTKRTVVNFLQILVTGLWALFYFDIFHFYGRAFVTLRKTPSKNLLERLFERYHLPFLKMLGKKIFFTFIGTDMRIPGITKNIIPYQESDIATNYDANLKLYALRIIDQYADGIFFPPPLGLEKLISNSNYFTVFINLNNFENVGISGDLNNPKIVHAPSNRLIKGTDYVEKAIKELKKEGYKFKFVLLENLKQKQFFTEIETADIILDQFIVGGYGKFALEAMAMGKPVFGYINEYYLPFYPTLPIIRTDKNELTEKIRFYLENPDKLLDISKKSREFVEQFHDSRKLAFELERIYLKSFSK